MWKKRKKRQKKRLKNNQHHTEGHVLHGFLFFVITSYSIHYTKLYDLRNQVFVTEGLGCIYTELGDYSKAKQLFLDGLKLAIENSYGYYIIQLYYEDLARVYERTGNIEDAYKAYKNYKIYLDSMRLEERLFQAASIEKKYEFSKNEALISKLNAEKIV